MYLQDITEMIRCQGSVHGPISQMFYEIIIEILPFTLILILIMIGVFTLNAVFHWPIDACSKPKLPWICHLQIFYFEDPISAV